MSTSETAEARAERVEIVGEAIVVRLHDGRVLQVPLVWFPRLLAASDEARADLRLIADGAGVHWPQLDEDLSVAGLLAPAATAPHRA